MALLSRNDEIARNPALVSEHWLHFSRLTDHGQGKFAPSKWGQLGSNGLWILGRVLLGAQGQTGTKLGSQDWGA